MRFASGRASGSPNPPASSAGVNPRGSSSSASGLPRVSARIRSRTRSSTRPGIAGLQQRAGVGARRGPSTRSSGSPASSSAAAGSRTAKTIAMRSASRRRATNASTCAEARSSHCASSTRHTSGRASAASASRLRTARATRKRSGALPSCRPNATPSASCWGAGSAPIPSSSGAHRWCRPANASSISACTPTARATRHPVACSATNSSRAVLPMPASPRSTSTALSPMRMRCSSAFERGALVAAVRAASNRGKSRRAAPALAGVRACSRGIITGTVTFVQGRPGAGS